MERRTERRGPRSRQWRRRRGLTLIELVIVIVIVVILVAIAYPRVRAYRTQQGVGPMQDDLRRVAAAQQAYAARTHAYAADLATLGVTPSEGVQISIGGAGLRDATGWNATAASARTPARKCYAAAGTDTVVGGIAVAPGAVKCQ